MIEAYHVTKTYERGDRPAIHDVNFDIAKGEFVFLSGPSGAGTWRIQRLEYPQGCHRPNLDASRLSGGRNRLVSRLSPVWWCTSGRSWCGLFSRAARD